jgi:hypothetical protein
MRRLLFGLGLLASFGGIWGCGSQYPVMQIPHPTTQADLLRSLPVEKKEITEIRLPGDTRPQVREKVQELARRVSLGTPAVAISQTPAVQPRNN